VQRTDVAAAANARIERVITYDPDPRGARMFYRLTGAVNRALNRQRAVIDTTATFHGAIPVTVQSFAGMAPLGQVSAISPRNSEMTDERAAGVLDSPHMRVFAERLRRGR
jgi:hypothetical protein